MNTIIIIIVQFLKNLLIIIILLWLMKLNRVIKFLTLKLVIQSGLLIIFSKGYTKNRPPEIPLTNYVLKTNPWKSKNKDLNGEKIIGSYYEKQLLLSIL